jgi:acetyl-CoA carboxylase beta subunit
MMIAINPDTLRERIRERSEDNNWQLCPYCDAGLSTDDLEYATCSNCGSAIDVNDESVDEGLFDD